MRYLFLFTLILIFPCLNLAQDVDSLRRTWQDTLLADSIRLSALHSLNQAFIFSKPDSALILITQQMKFAKERGLRKWEGNAYNLFGTYYLYRDLARAEENYLKSLAIFDTLNDLSGRAKNYFNLGLVYQERGSAAKALNNYQAALRIYEDTDEKGGMARAYLSMGNIYLNSDDSLALSYFEKSLENFEVTKFKTGIAGAHGNMGIVFKNRKDFEKALFHTNKSLEINEELGNKAMLNSTYMQLAEIYVGQGDLEASEGALLKSLEVSESINSRRQIAAASFLLGDVYNQKREFLKARDICKKGLDISVELGFLEAQKGCQNCLANAYFGLGDTRNAFFALKKFTALTDSVNTLTNRKELTKMEVRYSYERQMMADSIQISRLEAERTENLLALSRQKQIRNAIIGGGAAVLLFLLGLYLFYRNNQQKKEIAIKQDYISKLQHVDKLKDQFLANTSHELRTPLNGIIGLAESLVDGVAGVLPAKAVQNLNMIQYSGRRLANLVNDILDFSKLRNKDILLQKSPVDLFAVTNVVLALSQPIIKDKQIELLNLIPKDVALVDGDENRIEQILHNLIGNGIKFTEKGSVVISSAVQGNDLAITVSDTGIGIAEDQFEAIFRSFEQGDGSTERAYGGTGLGLSVTKQLVELHGGKIYLKSTVGKGSEFTFTLPLSQEKREGWVPVMQEKGQMVSKIEVEESIEVMAADLSNTEKRAKILIVDDEPVNRQVLENHLSLAGYDSVQAGNGREALDLIQKYPRFDLILLDIMMPRMSGYEVCLKIREQYLPSELPIIMLTAKNRISDLVEGFQVGGNDYVTKPFSKDELLSRIRTHLEIKRINVATGKFVPREFLSSIGKPSITEVELGDQALQEVTVFFSDIRSYTSLAEKMTPEENFKFVNSYVRRMGPVITSNKGFVNQYYGDGIMAIFPKEADHALRAAVNMQLAVKQYNKERLEKGRPGIKVGMGFHSGPLIMGIIGDEERNEVATISDTVNTAARFEGLTKYFGASILMSGDSYNSLSFPDAHDLRYLGQVLVKGKFSPLGVYECIGGDDPEVLKLKLETLHTFNEAMKAYLTQNFELSTAAFREIVSINPNDGAAKFFLEKSELLRISGVPENWTGVETMLHK